MTDSPSHGVKLFGTEEAPTETEILTAGDLTAELDAGNLRYIKYRGREVIRAISYVVRDKVWGTYAAEIEGLSVAQESGRFTVTYEASCGEAGQQFRYRAKIVGSDDGRLRFEAVGEPVTDFLTNRTGFVVLHGVDGIAGQPVEVLHVDGSLEQTRFPELIDPKQPIEDIRALTHEVQPGLKAVCTMEGDSFEMEDQRNWTDASYKTYVRPLSKPFPYTLPAGEPLEQAVTLRLEGKAEVAHQQGEGAAIRVSLEEQSGQLPRFGMGLEAPHARAALDALEPLSKLRPAFLSCFFDARSDGQDALRSAQALSEALSTELAVELLVPGKADPKEELEAFAEDVRLAGAKIASLAVAPAGDLNFVMPGTVFPDTADFDRLFAAARRSFPDVLLGGGSFAYFTELNRKPVPMAVLDFLCHTTSALVHAADDRSVTETLEALPYIIASGRALAAGKDYRIGPASIGSRSSPFGAPTTPNPDNRRVTMTRSDPRQRGLLGAAWHLGYGARMAEGAVGSVVLGAPIGPFGLLHNPMPTPQPWFDEAGGGLYPVYHVMRGLYAASGAPRIATACTRPRDLQALAFETAGGRELWLANLTGEHQRVEIEGLDAERASVARLDEVVFEACAADPAGFDGGVEEAEPHRLALRPYAVVRIRT
ncbi:MAG: hypothetical protein RIC87_06875 [Kiloniellales bacterium]